MTQNGKSRHEIMGQLAGAIERCLSASGHAMPVLREDQCPLTTIQGFDSLCGIEVTVDLQERLRLTLENNIFVKINGTKITARTLDEIVDALLKAAK